MNVVQMSRALLLAGLFGVVAAHAAPPPAPDGQKPAVATATAKAKAVPAKKSVNEECLECHDEMEPKAGQPPSVHDEEKLKCTDCHVGAKPDHDELDPVNCGTAGCHEKAAKAYVASVHGQARKGGNKIAASCVDCHGNHEIKRNKDPDSNVSHTNVAATCSKCHGDDKVVAKGKLPGGNIGGKFHDSIHGKALKGAAQASAPSCNNCHGAHSILSKSDEDSKTASGRIAETCGTCHKPQRAEFMKGMHGKLNQEGDTSAPTCIDCHSAHGIQEHDSSKFVTSVIEECGTCHAGYLKTYRDTFHGQVTQLGYTRVATCASCHGAHTVLPASDPASKVSKQNRVKTCQNCHPGASENFASFDPHANRHDPKRDPLFYYAAKFMEFLLFGVFSFFGLHTILWFGRELVDKISSSGRKEKH